MKTERQKFELTGIVGPNGALDRSLQAGLLFVPSEITLDDKDRLVWNTHHLTKEWCMPAPGLLDAFIELAGPEVPASTFLQFAKRWGVFGFCKKHGLPACHNQWPGEIHVCGPLNEGDNFWEPIARWRYIARRAVSMLNIACALENSKPGDEKDWAIVNPRWLNSKWLDDQRRARRRDDKAPGDKKLPIDVLVARDLLEEQLQWWLLIGQVCIGFHWVERGWSITLDAGGFPNLYGTLGRQLVSAIARSGGLAICSACGLPYPPKRRPNPKRLNFCDRPTCGRKVAVRLASRRYLAKKRRAERKRGK